MNLDDLKEHGGPAFPVHRMEWDFNNPVMATKHPGMTLRDYFAAKAMQAIEAPNEYMGAVKTQQSFESWARRCWKMADAMLAARGEA